MRKILTIIGTRPEAIKMASVIKRLEKHPDFSSRLCVTGQHREMLDQVLDLFEIKKDYDLELMDKVDGLSDLISGVISGIDPIIKAFKPEIILVHGDTATTFAASMAGFLNRVKIGHVEAGLRTDNLFSPWPEEANRKLTSVITEYHFAPTITSKSNLIAEGHNKKNIFVVGNTVIDSLFITRDMLVSNKKYYAALESKFKYLDRERKLILVTGHRRENFGDGFKNICMAIKKIAQKNNDIEFVYPVHLNPNVKKPVDEILTDVENVLLIEPLEYREFVYLMMRSYIILTDSGGIQEEAPSLGKPVLVMRDTTERPEAVSNGTVKLVGTDISSIINGVEELLGNKFNYAQMSKAKNPYGDGTSAKKIIEVLEKNNQ